MTILNQEPKSMNVDEFVFHSNFEPNEYVLYVNNVKSQLSEQEFENYYKQNIDNFFHIWKRNIFNLVYERIQMPLEDLPDFPYRSSFEEGGIEPLDMARYILENIP